MGERYLEVLKDFDDKWDEENRSKWQNRFQYVAHAKQSLQKYRNKNQQDLTDDELWEFASWTGEFESEDEAYPLYCAFQKRKSESIGAAYYVGKILAQRNELEALDNLKIAFNSPHTLEDVAKWGYDLLKQKGEDEKAEQWWDDALSANLAHQNAHLERSQLTMSDEFEKATISDELLGNIKQQLTRHKNVGSAWLAQKILKHDSEKPVYAIAFRPRGLYLSYRKVINSVAESLAIDDDAFVVCTWGDTKKLGKKIKKNGMKIM